MSIHILPNLLPDETIYGLAAHIAQINGYRSDQETCEKLFGKSKQPRVADIAVNFAHFSRATRGAFGDVEQLVRSTTSLALFARLGLYDDSNYKQLGTTEQLGLASLSNGFPHLWRWCECCIDDDINLYGTPYWHRRQQLPGVFVCTKHKTSLMEITVPFRARQQYFMHPNALPKTMPIRQTFPSGVDIEIAFNLACFVEHASECAYKQTDSNIPSEVINDRLASLGFLTKNGILRKPAFTKAFDDFLESFAHIEEIASLISNQNQDSPDKHGHKSKIPSVALRRILVIYWLFGEWDLFSEYCSWRNVFKSTKAAENKLAKISTTDNLKTEDHYKVCIEFLQINPDASRSYFLKVNPQSYRWLMRKDKAWMGLVFNATSRRSGWQLDMFNAALIANHTISTI